MRKKLRIIAVLVIAVIVFSIFYIRMRPTSSPNVETTRISYDRGISTRNPKVLQYSGVNIIRQAADPSLQLQKASETFNFVRIWLTQWTPEWQAGQDPLTQLFASLPSDLKVMPIIFNGYGHDSYTELKQAGLLDAWVNYVMQPAFQAHYFMIDVYNEPGWAMNGKIDAETESNVLDAINRVRMQTSLPVAVGFHGLSVRDSPDAIGRIEQHLNISCFHFYNANVDYLERFKDVLNFYRAFGKPMICSEFQLETANQVDQNYWDAAILNEIKNQDLMGYAVHCLVAVSNENFGIYNNDWTPKPCINLFP